MESNLDRDCQKSNSGPRELSGQVNGVDSNDVAVSREISRRSVKAFSKVWDDNAEPIFKYLIGVLNDRQAAEDIFQETFLVVWTKAAGYNGSGPMDHWIMGIARNKAMKFLALRSKTRSLQLLEEDESESDQIDDYVILRGDLELAMSMLQPIHREILVLAVEFELKEISQALDIPLGTVKSRLFEARKQLSKMVSQGDGKDE